MPFSHLSQGSTLLSIRRQQQKKIFEPIIFRKDSKIPQLPIVLAVRNQVILDMDGVPHQRWIYYTKKMMIQRSVPPR